MRKAYLFILVFFLCFILLVPTVLAAETTDYVDNNTSDVDSHADHGTESSFAAEQSAPDSSFGTLTEAATSSPSNTTLLNDGFEVGTTNFDGNGASGWSRVTSYTASGETINPKTGSYYASFPESTSGQYLSCDNLDMSSATAIYVSFWFFDDDLDPDDFVLSFWDGAGYDIIQDLSTSTESQWNYYSTVTTDSQYFDSDFHIRINCATGNNEAGGIDDVTIIRTSGTYNYELDLERQWTSADYDETTGEELCIYTGTLNGEALKVDVWNGSGWTNIIASLSASQWNNASIASYLTGSTFTIRFLGGTESSDTTQSSWQIDSVLIHTWTTVSTNYVAEFSQGVSTGFNLYPSAAFKIANSISATYAWSAYMNWSATTAFTQGVTHTFSLDPIWNTSTFLTQGLFTTFNLAPQTNFTVATSLATTFGFIIDTIHEIFTGNNYIVDFSLAVSTAFNVFAKWTALADLAQTFSVSMEIVVGSVFHITQSLSASFSFAVDILQASYVPVAYAVDLTLDLTSNFVVELLSGLQYSVTMTLDVIIELTYDQISGVVEVLSGDSLVLGAVLAVVIIGPILVSTAWYFARSGDDD